MREKQPSVTTSYFLEQGPVTRDIAMSGVNWVEVPSTMQLFVSYNEGTLKGSVWVENVQPAFVTANAPMGRATRLEATAEHVLTVLKGLEGNPVELARIQPVVDPYLARRKKSHPDEAPQIEAYFKAQLAKQPVI